MRPGPVLFRLSVAVLAASQILSGCDKPRTKPEPEPVAAPAPNPVTPPTIPPVALNRAALLEALDQAASAFAATRKPPADDIAGRRFIVRQAFGCSGPGPAPQAGIAHWAWDPDHRTITITLKPADWIAEPPFNDPSNLWEAVEGVWISRPWMREEGCPAAQPLVPAPTPAPADQGAKQDTAAKVGAAPAPRPVKSVKLSPPPEVAGMAAVFAQGGSRVGRRDGAPFAFTLRADGGEILVAPTTGYRLVLEGRLTAFAEGGAIRCRADSPDSRPVCFAAAEIDRVAFEDAEGKLLREWRPG